MYARRYSDDMSDVSPWHGLLQSTTSVPDGAWWAAVVAAVVIDDDRLPTPGDPPFVLRLSGGAGAVVPTLTRAARADLAPAGLVVTLRDLDDLAGNARRVVAALDEADREGVLPDSMSVWVGLPEGPPSATWLAAADEVAMVDQAVSLAWNADSEGQRARIDALLDRELTLRWTGIDDASAALAALTAVDQAWSGDQGPLEVGRARRWCRAIETGSPGVVAEGLPRG